MPEVVSVRTALNAGELAAALALLAASNAHEGLDLDLGLELLAPGAGSTRDHFLYYAGDLLAGYARFFPGEEPEACGVVHPEHRRRGVARALLAAVLDECCQRGVRDLLITCEDIARPGQAFAAAVGARFKFAEHTMQLAAGLLPDPLPPAAGFDMRPADPADVEALVRIRMAAFGSREDEVRRRLARGFTAPNQQFFTGTLNGTPIATLNVLRQPDATRYIRAVAVLPEHQGRGYGRRLLQHVVGLLRARDGAPVLLDVRVDNRGALALYHACGFEEVSTYNYYQLPVEPP